MSYTRIIKGVVSKKFTLTHLYSHFENTYWLKEKDEVFYSIIVEADMMVLTNIPSTPSRKKAIRDLQDYIKDTHTGESLELVGVF